MHNFFEHQERARSMTARLVALMILAVASLIAVTVMASAATLEALQGFTGAGVDPATGLHAGASVLAIQNMDPGLIALVAGVVTGGILLLSLFKTWQLRAGGSKVATMMGGTLINPSTGNLEERKVLNVVKEMSISAGIPMPPVFLINDETINAFAAGHNETDAAIGVTRGAIQQLSRAELQGVIAHEFSHIANGDMRMNMRLVSMIYGLTFIGLAGDAVLRISSSGKKSGGNPLLALGITLIVLGFAGTFFGRIIQAAVSRQREYLADASAVQFTRNPSGIASALGKIARSGSKLTSPRAAQFSHMMFGQTSASFAGLLATHPPVDERIRRIDGSKGKRT